MPDAQDLGEALDRQVATRSRRDACLRRSLGARAYVYRDLRADNGSRTPAVNH